MSAPPATPWLDPRLTTCQSEVLPIESVVLKHPRAAFGDRETIERDWRSLGYTAAPDFARAVAEYDAFAALIESSGARVHWLPGDGSTGLDSLYPRDAAIVSDLGVIVCRMGKPERHGEPEAQARHLASLGVPLLGRIEPPGTLEGGDVAWLDRETLAVGRTYRSNEAGLEQLAALVGPGVEILRMDAPHWRGAGDVFHLMSVLSPVDERKLLVFSPLMAVPFREQLLARDFELIEVPDDEFDSLGGNVLALAPGAVIIPAGNHRTRARLERAGVESLEIECCEICLKGAGGPTCLSRPLTRSRTP